MLQAWQMFTPGINQLLLLAGRQAGLGTRQRQSVTVLAITDIADDGGREVELRLRLPETLLWIENSSGGTIIGNRPGYELLKRIHAKTPQWATVSLRAIAAIHHVSVAVAAAGGIRQQKQRHVCAFLVAGVAPERDA